MSAVRRGFGAAARSTRSALLALRAVGRVLPHRSCGAVQGPVAATADLTEIWGWAAFPNDHVVAVQVTVNGRPTGAVLRPPPADVASSQRWSWRAHFARGWATVVDLAPYAQQHVTIKALALSARGHVERLPPMRIAVGRPREGALDEPVTGDVVERRVVVSGWAVPNDRPLARIEMTVDGEPAGPARPFAVHRPDIGAVRSAPGALLSGFEGVLHLDRPSGSRVTIGVEIVDVDGRRVPLPAAEVVVAESPPRAPLPTGPATAYARRSGHRPTRPPGPLRVFAVSHALTIGGGQLFLAELLSTLVREDGVELALVSQVDGPIRADLEALGAEVSITLYPVWDYEQHMATARELEHMIRDFRADVVIVNTMVCGVGAVAARRAAVPVVWAVHESFSLDDFFDAAFGAGNVHDDVRTSIVDALARAQAITFEADATRDSYAAELGSDRCVTVRYGIDLDAIGEHRADADRAALRDDHGVAADADVLLCAASYEPRKAQALLVSAFAQVAADHPDALLVLLGAHDGAYPRAVRDLIDRSGLSDRVLLREVTRDPYDWFTMADAFVLASDIESMPRVLLEAMAFELPIAATGVWGVPELITDGENGLLFEPRDVCEAAAALRRVLEMSAEERAALGAAGVRTVHKEYGMGYVESYRRLIRGLAADPTATPSELLGR